MAVLSQIPDLKVEIVDSHQWPLNEYKSNEDKAITRGGERTADVRDDKVHRIDFRREIRHSAHLS